MDDKWYSHGQVRSEEGDGQERMGVIALAEISGDNDTSDPWGETTPYLRSLFGPI